MGCVCGSAKKWISCVKRVWCRKVRGWRRWPIFAIVGSVVLAPKVVWRRQVFDAALARGDWLD